MAEDSTPPFAVPAGWEVVADSSGQTALVAREPADPARPDRFRANLVATAVPVGGLSFRDWQAGTDELLPRVLDDYLLVDLQKAFLDDRPAGRRLAHHAGPGGEALTMEQWFTLVDGVGHTLTATIETWHYDELADRCAEVARTWRPGGEA